MLLWLLICITVASVGLLHLCDKKYWDFCFAISAAVAIVSGFSIIVSVGVMISNYAGAEGKIASFDEYRQMIETKIESGVYADELGILDKSIVNEIRNYNTQVRYKQAYSHDFWVGVFHPKIYDGLELIEYDIVPARE